MSFEIPKSLKPVFDFAIHVVVGSVAFIIVMGASALISVFVKVLDGIVPSWFELWAERAEMGLFALDMFCFALFVVSEAIKLARGLWREWSHG